MSKPVKELVTKEINARFGQLDSVMVVNPIGLNAIDNNVLRLGLKKKKIEMEVVKNSIAARALKGTKLEQVDQLLMGTCALVTGGDSIVDVARELFDWTKKMKQLEIRGALVEGTILDAKGAEVLSKMPSRAELQSQVVNLAKSPGARLAGAISSPAGRIAGCVKALVEKKEKEGDSVAAA